MSVPGTRSEQLTWTSPRAVTQTRAFFFLSSGLIYAAVTIAASLTLNAYFAQTWDIKTFILAAHRFLDGGNPFDLYAQSRAAQTWPYAYPPLHALVTAIFLSIGNLFPMLPDYVWARIPALLADVGVGIVLYAIVQRKSSDDSLARLTMLLWLFNPVTFYDTAVQGHFESEWILFVLLAYLWLEDGRGIVLPTIALAIAILFKQVAILFAVPLWLFMLKAKDGKRIAKNSSGLIRVAISVVGFGLIVGAVCLPYLLYSNDFVYMNLTYLEGVPAQTQSWLVVILALTRPNVDAMTSDFFLIRYQTIIALVTTIAISFFAMRHGASLYLTAALVAIAFFLTSKKVMGYYYVMLFPFLIAEFLPRRRFVLVLGAILLTAWISLSPYYAPWSDSNHIWIYAILGAINSALFIWMFAAIWQRMNAYEHGNEIGESSRVDSPSLSFISVALFATAALAAVLQPFAPNGGSPIRVPIISPGAEPAVLAAFGALIALTLVGMWIASRKIGNIPRMAWATTLLFAPFFFVVYYLTKESTAVFELVLKTFGV